MLYALGKLDVAISKRFGSTLLASLATGFANPTAVAMAATATAANASAAGPTHAQLPQQTGRGTPPGSTSSAAGSTALRAAGNAVPLAGAPQRPAQQAGRGTAAGGTAGSSSPAPPSALPISRPERVAQAQLWVGLTPLQLTSSLWGVARLGLHPPQHWLAGYMSSTFAAGPRVGGRITCTVPHVRALLCMLVCLRACRWTKRFVCVGGWGAYGLTL